MTNPQLEADIFLAQSTGNPWMLTFTGVRVNPLDLKVEQVFIEDIAHQLATFNRYVGATVQPISVAQHSWHLSYLLEGTGEELEGLMHDDEEAYLGDMLKWLKLHPMMEPYRDACSRAHKVCAQALGYSPLESPHIKHADNRMVAIEAGYALTGWVPNPAYPRATSSEMRQARFDGFWSWQKAEALFLDRYNELQHIRRERCSFPR